jgi:hypothetical protein
MTRTFTVWLTLVISTMTNGQGKTFDEKVQQLFFDVDVSNQHISLVDKLARIKELAYKKPNEYGVHRLTGIDWKHSFIFTHHPYLTNHFDTGLIDIKIREQNNFKSVFDLSWTLEFDKLKDAKKVFEELKNNFSQTKAITKFYTSDLALETAEFTDKTAKKYPYIMFMLFDNNNLDKRYKIIFGLDNEMHYEN